MGQTTTILSPQPQGLDQGEKAVLLDGTLRVAISVFIKRDAVNSSLTAIASVRAINEDGTPILDGHGQPIIACHPRSCAAASITSLDSENQLAQDALKMALGDTSDDTLGVADDNIRAAVAAAALSGPISDPSSLLNLAG